MGDRVQMINPNSIFFNEFGVIKRFVGGHVIIRYDVGASMGSHGVIVKLDGDSVSWFFVDVVLAKEQVIKNFYDAVHPQAR